MISRIAAASGAPSSAARKSFLCSCLAMLASVLRCFEIGPGHEEQDPGSPVGYPMPQAQPLLDRPKAPTTSSI